jgi:hypothetical protein
LRGCFFDVYCSCIPDITLSDYDNVGRCSQRSNSNQTASGTHKTSAGDQRLVARIDGESWGGATLKVCRVRPSYGLHGSPWRRYSIEFSSHSGATRTPRQPWLPFTRTITYPIQSQPPAAYKAFSSALKACLPSRLRDAVKEETLTCCIPRVLYGNWRRALNA